MQLGSVEIRASHVCDGVGVFTTTDVKQGTCVTEYSGHLVRSTKKVNNDYALELGDGWTLVGDEYATCASSIGQLANDAIHLEISGKKNNCEFHFAGGRRVFLRTLVDVPKDTELLVEYHITYWLGRSNRPELPLPLTSWLKNHEIVAEAVQRKGWELARYITRRGNTFKYAIAPRHKKPKAVCLCKPSASKKIYAHMDDGARTLHIWCQACLQTCPKIRYVGDS